MYGIRSRLDRSVELLYKRLNCVPVLRFAGWLSGVDRSRLDEYVPKTTIIGHAE